MKQLHRYFFSKTVRQFCIFLLTICCTIQIQSQVSLTSSGGTTTSATYTTLSAAFGAINGGVLHTGSIVITITSNTTEPFAMNALTSTSFASLLIKPQGANIVVTGNNPTNRGVIELMNSKNVTIDGDDPAQSGDRNLTFAASTSSVNGTSAIRIGSTSGAAADNIAIRNCILRGSKTNSTTTTANYGISISNATTSISPANAAGVAANAIIIENNEIYRAQYGVFVFGGTASGSSFKNITIKDNKIGSTTAADVIGQAGITMIGSSDSSNRAYIENNEIMVLGEPNSTYTKDAFGIDIQNFNPNLVITRNYIHDIKNLTTSTSVNVVGIKINGTINTGIEISNNIIRDVVTSQKTATIGANSSYGMYIAGNVENLTVMHNTIGLIATNPNFTSNNYTCGVYINSAVDVARFINNIVVNKNVSTKAMALTILGAGFTNTIFDNNCYLTSNGDLTNTHSTLQLWQIGTGRDNSSFIEYPPFVSNTNLHIQTGTVTRVESRAMASTVSFDIDNENRPGPSFSSNGGGTIKDIGADEFDGFIYAKPVINTVAHNRNGSQSCASTNSYTVLTGNLVRGNALDTVWLEYSYNGGAKTTVPMDSINGSAGIYSKVIPNASPAEAIVRYRVFCTTKVGDTVSSNYFYYCDFVSFAALFPTLSSNYPSACSGSTIELSYSFPPDPTGVFFPASVSNPTSLSDITAVSFGGVNNTSSVNSLTGAMGTATGTAGAYSNFRNLGLPSFNLGQSYSVSMTSAGSTTSSKDYFAAFIDFNGDGDFIDVNEMVFNSISAPTNGPRTEVGQILIHPSARPGNTTVRFMVSNAPITNAIDPINSGEVEDYSIKINPLTYTWYQGATSLGTNNPKSVTLSASPPVTFSLEIMDANGCVNPTPPTISIANSTTNPSVSISGPSKLCYNNSATVTANVSGGCPPYTFAWSNGSNNTTSTIVMLNSSITLYLTITDNNGVPASSTITILPDTPKLGNLTVNSVVCNRGSAILNAVVPTATDSVFWYDNINADPYTYIYRGKPYTTPLLNATKVYYAAAFRSQSALIGRTSLAGASSSSLLQNYAGLTFTVTAPIIMQRCSLYIAGTSGATINIGVLDKYGTIVAQTGNFAPTMAASATTPTIVPLNFNIFTPDVGYKLVILDMQGITTFNRNTGVGYPISSGQPMVITGTFNPFSTASGDYNYFYNILIQKGLCVGEKKPDTVEVRAPKVPKITQDLEFTPVCRGKDTFLRFNMDSVGIGDTLGLKKKYIWIRNGQIWLDSMGSVYGDTSLKKQRNVFGVKASDTGYYRVIIHSDSFCYRDTFTREVKLEYYPEAKVTREPTGINMCLKRNATLSVAASNAFEYKWQKIMPSAATLQTGSIDYYTIGDASAADNGTYRVIVQDIHRCIPDTSLTVRVSVFDTPQITMHPMDTVVCEDEKIVLKAKAINTLTYQWYMDNGVLPFFVRDSLIIYNATKADSGWYRLYAYSYPGCPVAVSNQALLVVNTSPKILGLYPDIRLCEDTKLRMTVSARDHNGLQWYKNNINTGITSDSFVVNTMTASDTGRYYIKALSFNRCPAKTSDTFRVSMAKKASFTGFVRDSLICAGMPYRAAFGTKLTNFYQWYKNGATLQSETDSVFSLDYTSAQDTGTYYLRINSDPVCPELFSPSFKLRLQPAVEITLYPIGDTLCKGANYTMTVQANNASAFQWKRDNLALAGANTISYKVQNLSASNEGKYSVEIMGISPCPSKTTTIAPLYMKSGARNAHLTLVSNYDAVEQCTDDEDWTYYSTSEDADKFIFAVRKNGNSFRGKADVFLKPNLIESKSINTQGYIGTLMLNRFWNLKVDTGELTSPIDVKFYINKDETNALEAKVNDYKRINATDTSFKFDRDEITWFKSDSLPFVNSLLSTIQGNKLNFKYKLLMDTEEGQENNIDYIIFYGVTNIGGGTGMYQFKAAPRIISSIVENEPLSSSIYPNPNDGHFTLNLYSKDLGDVEMEVYNTLGQKVADRAIKIRKQVQENALDMSELSNGMYQVVLRRGELSRTLKLQIQK